MKTKNLNSELAVSLRQFVEPWYEKYAQSLNAMKLFTAHEQLTKEQQIYFVQLVYHLYRLSSQEILWYLGNHAPNLTIKQSIIDNIREEMGGAGRSHEEMYHNFAVAVGIDIKSKYFMDDTYPSFVSGYKRGWIEWLQSGEDQDTHSIACLLSAWEKLDNVDFLALLRVAETFNVPQNALTFFKVHCEAKHFEIMEPVLLPLWEKNSQKVEEIFQFVSQYELKMRQQLSDAVCNS
ncbi:iron-containing redox enzyme family protein [Phormidium sp. CCY1219]|uniref:iron-containing redox enzyme family protein n=1 Tax=Phormidium sp. CCY1219 TaxID=2886104 RepID=UPI002D1EB8D4|nr:iron-containing redox enzyme family protein [Phormidium sp. CCY1219]MEB3826155.1 iron-containing redox enzyme family protein [Phormidium sp. CCY1219]